MNNKKKLLFITGTRADFGKIKPLITECEENEIFEVYIFITGMHLLPRFGGTENEVHKCNFTNTHTFINQRPNDTLDVILANTIHGLGNYIKIHKPDIIIVHGDRVEALAGAIVGGLNNILVAHLEGGEVSGTIDESIRHSVTKLSHLHFVANEEAKKRLIQMGEREDSIYIIGSPDIDIMLSSKLPTLEYVKNHYDIGFDEYSLFIYHPVTSNLHNLLKNIEEVTSALVESKLNYVIIYPNNDPGSDMIIECLEMLRGKPNMKIFPSIRFEYYLVLLKNCNFIAGNSSAGIREAPIYGVPAINIGNRQNKRFDHDTIVNVKESKEEVLTAIKHIGNVKRKPSNHFGDGNSTKKFLDTIISEPGFWETDTQKYFIDINPILPR